MSTDDPHLETQALVANLLHERTLARSQIARGIAFVLLVPVVGVAMLTLTLMLDSIWPILAFILYTLGGGIFGAMSIVFGTATLRSAGKKIDEIQGEQIPKARLLT